MLRPATSHHQWQWNWQKRHNTRLHVFHLSTEKEIELFDNTLPLAEKRITAEICIHHLWFDESKYEDKGTLIKWNPAVKKASDKEALFQALLDDKLDVIATDHAPHTLEEKSNTYFQRSLRRATCTTRFTGNASFC